jgi:hypothetical protein
LTIFRLAAFFFVTTALAASQQSSAPQPVPIPGQPWSVQDSPFRGTLHLVVDATDTRHKIFLVHETIPVQAAGDLVLLYPQWDTGSHAPTISVANLAGLLIHAGAQPLEWRRDPIDTHAFHLLVPAGADELTLDFQYISPPIPRAGYRLVFSDRPSEAFLQNEAEDGLVDLSYSIGAKVTNSGLVKAVSWQGAAFNAGLGIGSQIRMVNGSPFTPRALLDAIDDSNSHPLTLEVEQDGQPSALHLAYRGKLAYPHIERIAGAPDLLQPRLAPSN